MLNYFHTIVTISYVRFNTLPILCLPIGCYFTLSSQFSRIPTHFRDKMWYCLTSCGPRIFFNIHRRTELSSSKSLSWSDLFSDVSEDPPFSLKFRSCPLCPTGQKILNQRGPLSNILNRSTSSKISEIKVIWFDRKVIWNDRTLPTFSKIPTHFRDKSEMIWLFAHPVTYLIFIAGQNYLHQNHYLEVIFSSIC